MNSREAEARTYAAAVVQVDQAVVDEVREEVRRQIEKWGVQAHPDGTGPHVPLVYVGLAAKVRDEVRATADHMAEIGKLTWRHILTEELFEALAEEPTSAELRAELIQTAAVCLSWIRDLDLSDRLTQAEAEAEAGLARTVE